MPRLRWSARFGPHVLHSGGLILILLSPVVLAYTEIAPSVLWSAAIQGIKRNQDLADLAPKDCFVAAEAVERVVGQIGKTQIAPRELNVGGPENIPQAAWPSFRFVSEVAWRRTMTCLSSPKKGINKFSRSWVNLGDVPCPAEMVSLNFEQPSFHCRGAA
jgi:hypothetical protein